jgi:phosphoglycolate phosphatase-like HAD superfamily hydrolase
MPPPDVLLDLDGPVLDVSLRHHRSYEGVLAALGREALPLHAYWALKREGASLGAQLTATGSEDLEERFRSDWLAAIERPELLALDRVQTGALAALAELRRRGRRVVLLTARRDRAALGRQLSRLRLSSLVAGVAAVRPGEDIVRAKVEGAQAEGARPGHGLVVGDTEVDVEVGRLLGLRTVAVACGQRNRARLAAQTPDELHGDLAEWLGLTPHS